MSKICPHCEKPILFCYEKRTEQWEEYNVGSGTIKHTKETYVEYWGERASVYSSLIELEDKAKNYARNIFEAGKITRLKEKIEVGRQKWWRQIVLKYLRKQSLIFVIRVLEHLKDTKTDWTIKFVDFVLDELQKHLFKLWQSNKIDELEKKTFKKKVLAKFPESDLAKILLSSKRI